MLDGCRFQGAALYALSIIIAAFKDIFDVKVRSVVLILWGIICRYSCAAKWCMVASAVQLSLSNHNAHLPEVKELRCKGRGEALRVEVPEGRLPLAALTFRMSSVSVKNTLPTLKRWGWQCRAIFCVCIIKKYAQR